MKTGKAAAVIVVLVLTIISAWAAVSYLGDYLKLGLDLKGGVQVRVQAAEGATDEDMEKIMSIMNLRVNSIGLTEPTIQREGTNRILIELPGVQDPEDAIAMIGKTAYLYFAVFTDSPIDGAEGEATSVDGAADEEGTTEDGVAGEDEAASQGQSMAIILDGSYLINAEEAVISADASRDPMRVRDEYVVRLDFNEEGRQIFAETTQQLVDTYPGLTIQDAQAGDWRRNIAIFLDEDLISVPFVSTAIPDGEAVITGYDSLGEARNLALLLKSGALPVPVEIVEKRTIGPTLGADSIQKSQIAGMVGLALVVLYVLIIYKLPGVIAGFSLVLYSVLLLATMALLRATLTLPGILGIVLSIGMCVDSNIIIYERLKDELSSGKTLRAAINAGFSRALWTIVDSNVTTLIAAAVLFWKGTGSIQGFAVTLSLGILISMFTAIVYTRFLLKNMAESGLFTNPKLYGWKGAES